MKEAMDFIYGMMNMVIMLKTSQLEAQQIKQVTLRKCVAVRKAKVKILFITVHALVWTSLDTFLDDLTDPAWDQILRKKFLQEVRRLIPDS